MHTLVVWQPPVAVRVRWQGWDVIRLKCADLLLPVDEARVEVRRGVRFRRGYVRMGPVANRIKWTGVQ